MKAFKKVLAVSLTICLVLSLSVGASALSTPAPTPPPYTQEELLIIQKNNEFFSKVAKPRNIVSYKNLSVPLYPQTADHCGPASVQMIVYFKNGVKHSLQAIDTEMRFDTYPSGPSADAISRTLNSYISGKPYFFYQLPKSGTNVATLRNWVMDSINNNIPLVCQTATGTMPGYNGRNFNHYVVVKGYRNGYQGATSVDNVIYNDPFGLIASLPTTYNTHEVTMAKLAGATSANSAGYVVKRKI